MKNSHDVLSKMSPTLKGSIITVSGHEHPFFHSSEVTLQSQFYVGSLSKQITAVILLSLLQKEYKKKLYAILQKKLSVVFPNSRLLKRIGASWVSEISLMDLLTHRSGLSDYIEAFEHHLKQSEALTTIMDPVQILKSVEHDSSKPYQYSNTNYFLLGKLIEEMTKMSFDKVFDSIIGKPAGMIHAYAPVQGNYFALKKDVRFSTLLPDLNKNFFIDMSNAVGCGNIIASSQDLLLWNQYLYTKVNPILRQILLWNYFRDEEEDWVNLGLTTTQTNRGPLIAFQGGQDSYRSFLAYFPMNRISIAILSNNTESFEKLMSAFKDYLQSLRLYRSLSCYQDFLTNQDVWLRPMFPDDHISLRDCFMDPQNMQYFGAGKFWSESKLKKRVLFGARENLSSDQNKEWTMIARDGIAGCFWAWRRGSVKETKETMEIAYCTRPAFSGRGLTTQAGKAVLNSISPDFAGEVFATVHPKNITSKRVLEKLGFGADPDRQDVPVSNYGSSRNYWILK